MIFQQHIVLFNKELNASFVRKELSKGLYALFDQKNYQKIQIHYLNHPGCYGKERDKGYDSEKSRF